MLRQVFNLPNRITLGRLLLSVALFAILTLMQDRRIDNPGAWGWVGFGLFVLAAASDWVDGYVARKYGMVTTFGRIMDPFVDKVIVCGSFVLISAINPHIVPGWMVVVILGREFFVNAIRGFMESRGVNFSAEMPGKVKMFLQCVAVSGALLELAVGTGEWLDNFVRVLVWIALVSTVHSGWFYARKAFSKLSEMEP